MKQEITLEKEFNEETINLLTEEKEEICINLEKEVTGGTSDYEKLKNKPSINGVELTGNKTTEDLGITDIELITKLYPESIEEDLKDNQVYNGNAIHDLARLFGMTLEELTKTLPTLLTEYDGQQHEDNEVYNANAVTNLIDLMALSLPKIITEFDIEKTYEDSEVYNANAIHQLLEIFVWEMTQIQDGFNELYDAVAYLVEKEPLVVTATFTLATQRLTNISHYYDKIKQARDNGQDVKLQVTIAESGNIATADISVLDVSKKSAFFYPIMRTNIGFGNEIYFFDVEIKQNTGSLASYVLQATSLGE